jgi:hypothetical protein
MLERMESLYTRLTHLERCLARHAERIGCAGGEGSAESALSEGRCPGNCSTCPDAPPTQPEEEPYADL